MKARDFGSSKARTERWLRAVASEYGQGSHVASAQRLADDIQQLCELSEGRSERITSLGREIAFEGHTLADANRWLELLAVPADEQLRELLDSRAAAIAVAQGWTDGTLHRRERLDSQITPLPAVLHLLRQQYSRPVDLAGSASEGPILVVVDVSQVVTDRLDTHRLRASLLRHLRSELPAAYPIAQGANGNLLVLVERSAGLANKIVSIDQAIVNDPALEQQVIRVWLEPLASDRIHLESHLAGLVGSPLE
jgi:hypothetical protein